MANGRRRGGRRAPGGTGRDQVRGTVCRITQDRNGQTIYFVTPDRLPAGYNLERGRGIFMAGSVVGETPPSVGDPGEFEIVQDDRGIRVVRVVRWELNTSTAPATTASRQRASSSQSFIHPYNFVRVPADGLGGAAGVEPFKRDAAAPHDRYDPDRVTGWLQCRLTPKTWWFIPDPRKQEPEGEHKVLGYFTLDAVDESAWSAALPEQDTTRPAIPASSLRGMVRSVFEAATLSCLSVFDSSGLDFRIGFDPGMVPGSMRVPPAQQPSYVPVRVVEQHADGTLTVQQLDGRRDRDPGNTLSIALLHAYDPRVKNRNGSTGQSTTLWSGLNLRDGAEIAAIVSTAPTAHRSNRFRYREASQVVPADQAGSLTPRNGEWLVFGYLHRTGPNIENKHHERIFFRADGPYNDPRSRQPITARLAAFQADRSPTLVVNAEVVSAAEQSLRGYAERHGRNRPRPQAIDAHAPHLSDFVGRTKIGVGDLCYAVVQGGHCVKGLYPVALPRLTHEDSRGDLLHPDFHPCAAPDLFCPACRVFGWVRPGEGGLEPEPGRVDAIAGHVRFTHATLNRDWGTGKRRARLATLAILGSPKPTTTAFYLQARDDYDQRRAERWPPILRTALHENIPLYRRDEASLRGRKFYRHRDSVNPDGAAGGILRPAGEDGQPIRDSQNQTVHLLPPDLGLDFRVHFDNLTSEELGALVFALTLRPPATWGQVPALRHAVGHGKPLGLGACEVTVEAAQIDVLDPSDPGHRYARVPSFQAEDGVSDEGATSLVSTYLEAFGRAYLQAEHQAPEVRRVRGDLVEMLRADPPDGPVHYPPDPEGDAAKNYEWFVHNRRAKASGQQPKGLGSCLPDPTAERDASSRLRRDPRDQQG